MLSYYHLRKGRIYGGLEGLYHVIILLLMNLAFIRIGLVSEVFIISNVKVFSILTLSGLGYLLSIGAIL